MELRFAQFKFYSPDSYRVQLEGRRDGMQSSPEPCHDNNQFYCLFMIIVKANLRQKIFPPWLCVDLGFCRRRAEGLDII